MTKEIKTWLEPPTRIVKERCGDSVAFGDADEGRNELSPDCNRGPESSTQKASRGPRKANRCRGS